MEYIPFSPFQRPITRGHLSVADQRKKRASVPTVGKWALFRQLSKARTIFGLSEREITVLQGLLSFYPEDTLGGDSDMVIFPSNKALCERLNGMACSTMRRYLAQLVSAGLVTRRDSPNGKRYSRKVGGARVAFGFDLSPLPRRSEEITRAAEAVRAAEAELRRAREAVSLMRRDLAAVAEYGRQKMPDLPIWDEFAELAAISARMLRRKLSIGDLTAVRVELNSALDHVRQLIDGSDTEYLSTNACQSEQHHQNSDTYTIESKSQCNAAPSAEVAPDGRTYGNEKAIEESRRDRHRVRIPLDLVTSCCHAVFDFSDGPIRHWHQLYNAACRVWPSMGISPSAWEEARRVMGPEQAAVVVIAMLERFTEIRSPGGYLRALTVKAANGTFSCGPMVTALMSQKRVA